MDGPGCFSFATSAPVCWCLANGRFLRRRVETILNMTMLDYRLRLMKEIPVSLPLGQRTSELDVLADLEVSTVESKTQWKVLLILDSPLRNSWCFRCFPYFKACINYAWNVNSTRMKNSLLHSLPLRMIFVDLHCLKKRLACAVWNHKMTDSSKQWIRLNNCWKAQISFQLRHA